MAIKDTCSSKVLNSPSDLEVLTIDVGLPVSLTICTAYIPPNCSKNYTDNFIQYFDALGETNRLVVVGDFNCPDICWSTLTSTSPFSSQLCDIVFKHNLLQVVSGSTHVKGNLLDLVLTDTENLIGNMQIKDLKEKSDHFMLTFDIRVQSLPQIHSSLETKLTGCLSATTS